MRLLSKALRRAAQGALVLWFVVTATFVLVRLAPGDPFSAVAGDENVPPAVRERLRAAYGLDAPLATQYARFVGNALRGELGWSITQQEPVSRVLARALPNTLVLMVPAFVIGLLGGIAVGAWQGWEPARASSRALDRLGLLMLSVPDFVVAIALLMGPALALGLFPVGLMHTEFAPTGLRGIPDLLMHLALPCFALAISLGTVIARHQAASLREVREALFVRQARARGIPERRILLRHALPQALVPVIAIAGAVLPAIVGGSVMIEKVFAWPGMGRVIVDGVLARDHHLVVGGVMLTTIAVLVGSALADAAQRALDPRGRA